MCDDNDEFDREHGARESNDDDERDGGGVTLAYARVRVCDDDVGSRERLTRECAAR